MSDADRRSVHTAALATLGTIIGPAEKRDAVAALAKRCGEA